MQSELETAKYTSAKDINVDTSTTDIIDNSQQYISSSTLTENISRDDNHYQSSTHYYYSTLQDL